MILKVYEERYNKYINHYKDKHVNPWHEISEEKLNELYINQINKIDIKNEFDFSYLMNYIIKRLSGDSDAHTIYAYYSPLPMNFRIFDNRVYINYPEDYGKSELISINNVLTEKIIKELEEVLTYGTEGKRKFELEKAFSNRFQLFSIPSLRNFDDMIFKYKNLNGEIKEIKLNKNIKYGNEAHIERINEQYGKTGKYKIINDVLIYNHNSSKPMYVEKSMESIEKIKNTNLEKVKVIIIDLRGNTGGSSKANEPLVNFLKTIKNKKLICLTDYRIFSGGRYALNDLIKLGAITIGEEISTPMNCYGNNNWIENDYFASSSAYLNPVLEWSALSKEEFYMEVQDKYINPIIFKPDILINEQIEDYLENKDVIYEYAIKYSKDIEINKK